MNAASYRRGQGKYWGAPVPAGLKHRPSSYAATVYGCDCKDCLPSGRRRKINPEGPNLTGRERRARSRQNLRGKPVPEGTKHGPYAYRVYRCRCEVCRASRSAESHRRKNPWMYRETRGHWGPGRDSTGAPVDVIWWPRAGQTAADCPLEECYHVSHKEAS